MQKETPYLSIVIYSRNDNYEGNAFERLQMTVDNLMLQAKKYQLSAELIIVDWNPPQDRPLLKDALRIADPHPLAVRFITVGPEVHARYRAHPKMNIIPVAALNVGIRRARGEFIWATNADLLFSNELIEFLASRKMEKDKFYRVFRYSVHDNVLQQPTLEARMAFCEKNIVEVFQKNTVSIHGLKEHPVLQTSCGGDFIVFCRESWEKIHGYPELNNLGAFTDWLLCYILYLSGLRETMLPDAMRVYHIDHKKHAKQREQFSRSASNFVRYEIYHKLPERHPARIALKHLNNLRNALMVAAMEIYYRCAVPLIRRFSHPGRFDLDTAYSLWGFHKVLRAMLKGKRSYVLNGSAWGMPEEAFPEAVRT